MWGSRPAGKSRKPLADEADLGRIVLAGRASRGSEVLAVPLPELVGVSLRTCLGSWTAGMSCGPRTLPYQSYTGVIRIASIEIPAQENPVNRRQPMAYSVLRCID